MPTRRRILQAAAALALPSVARAEGAQVLTVVPQVDLAVLDPVWTTTYQTRDHGFLVFDTLFGLDSRLQVSPQMAAGSVNETDGKTWRITLRDGLLFHDGSKVLARDAAASIRRWGERDGFGQSLLAACDEVSASDDKTILFRLKRPFPLLPDALAKASPRMCPIMPERLARTDPFTPVTEMVGSGPYCYKANERVPGDRVVYERNDAYVPRADGTPMAPPVPRSRISSGSSGGSCPIPRPSPPPCSNRRSTGGCRPTPTCCRCCAGSLTPRWNSISPSGFVATMRLNQLNPPFDNPAIRRAVIGAVAQADYMIGMVGTDPALWRNQVGYFCPNTPMASSAGLEAVTSPRDLDAVRKALADAGYNGETVVVLTPTDIASARALAEITADLLRKLGMAVEAREMDWATLVQLRVKTDPVGQGGWSIYHTSWAGLDMISPAGHIFLRGNGRAAVPGWPDSPRIEALRDEWFAARDLAAQQSVARRLQLQAFVDVPYIPLGQYFAPTAHQSNLTGILKGSPVFWNVRRS